MIVWIASYPRSGNRLCRTVLHRVFEQPVAVAGSEEAIRTALTRFNVAVDPDADLFPSLRDREQLVFIKSHHLPDSVHLVDRSPAQAKATAKADTANVVDDSAALYLIRDGRDCLVSLAHYLKDVAARPRFAAMPYEDVVADLIRDDSRLGGWSGHVKAWLDREGPVEVVRFEDVAVDPVETVRQGAEALGIDLEPLRKPLSFTQMRERAPNPQLVRRGKRQSWRTEFPPHLLDEFWERHGEQMEKFGYPRE